MGEQELMCWSLVKPLSRCECRVLREASRGRNRTGDGDSAPRLAGKLGWLGDICRGVMQAVLDLGKEVSLELHVGEF